jgi:hypothetical protein
MSNPWSDVKRMYPATETALIDFLCHTETIPYGTTLTVARDIGPVFLSKSAALRAAATATEPVLLIPSSCVPELSEAARFRRIERPAEEPEPEQKPTPVTGGINWDAYLT